MATLAEVTDPLRSIFTFVPPVGLGVCDVCHGAPNERFSRCYSCWETVDQVSFPVQWVVPISLYRVGQQLHHVLRSYKDSSVPSLRQGSKVAVAAILGRFLSDHAPCIRTATGAAWDGIVVVPSTRDRPGQHPLEAALELLKNWPNEIINCLVRGDVEIAHGRADDRGFHVSNHVMGRALLLVDDTFTTGARLQSAASALHLAGARVVAGLVIGRVMNPDFNEPTKTAWERNQAVPYSFERCCLEDDSA